MKHLNLNLFLSLSLFAGNSIASTNCKADNSYYSYNPSQEPVPKEATSKGRVYLYSLPIAIVRRAYSSSIMIKCLSIEKTKNIVS